MIIRVNAEYETGVPAGGLSAVIGTPHMAMLLMILAIPHLVMGEDRARVIPQKDVAAMLEFLSSTTKSNFERLRTWQGSYKFEERQYLDPTQVAQLAGPLGLKGSEVNEAIRVVTSGVIDFATDIDNNKLYTSFGNEASRHEFADTGRPLGVESLPFMQQSIITSEHYTHFEPNVRWGASKTSFGYGPSGKRAAYRDPVAKGERQDWGVIVDPRIFASGGRQPIWEILDRTVAAIRDVGVESFAVGARPLRLTETREGGQLKLCLTMPFKGGGGALMISEMIFDESCGSNITSAAWTDEGGRVRFKTEYEYVLKDGAYIPSRIRRINLDRDGLQITFQRTLELTRCEVNKPISEDVFTYKTFGLTEGERLIDNIEGREYVMKNGKLEVPIWDLEADLSMATNPELVFADGAPVEAEGKTVPAPGGTVGRSAKGESEEVSPSDAKVSRKGALQWQSMVIAFAIIAVAVAGVAVWVFRKHSRTARDGG